jgi:hypothetical protein
LTCPGFSRWKRHRGAEYLVFLDESFFEFFQLTAKTGYFTHGMLGVPERNYERLRQRFVGFMDSYRAVTGTGDFELKHSVLRRVPYASRRRITVAIRDMLLDADAFIAGFFTPSRAFLLERVRSKLVTAADGSPVEIPDDHHTMLDEALTELRGELKGRPGMSALLFELLLVPIGAVAQMLSFFESPFRVVYDPRNPKEDLAVRRRVAELMEKFDGRGGRWLGGLRMDVGLRYLGLELARRSDEEPGLQIADLVAGEVAAFFQAFPELLSHHSSRALATPTSRESDITVEVLNGRLVKTGCLHRMPFHLRRRFFEADKKGRTLLPLFRNLLAAGGLSCFSSWGQLRQIMVFEKWIWDMVD